MTKAYKQVLYAHREIETQRLILRPLDVEKDAADLLELFADKQSAYFNFTSPKETVDEVKLFLLNVFFKPYGVWAVVEKESGKCIGTVDLVLNQIEKNDAVTIGYGLVPNKRGQGYATEMVKTIVQICFEKIELTRIGANVNPENKESCKLLERCGFTKEGVIRKYQRATDGELVDMAVYGVIPGEV